MLLLAVWQDSKALKPNIYTVQCTFSPDGRRQRTAKILLLYDTTTSNTHHPRKYLCREEKKRVVAVLSLVVKTHPSKAFPTETPKINKPNRKIRRKNRTQRQPNNRPTTERLAPALDSRRLLSQLTWWTARASS